MVCLPGAVEQLQAAAAKGTFLLVGIWDDDEVIRSLSNVPPPVMVFFFLSREQGPEQEGSLSACFVRAS